MQHIEGRESCEEKPQMAAKSQAQRETRLGWSNSGETLGKVNLISLNILRGDLDTWQRVWCWMSNQCTEKINQKRPKKKKLTQEKIKCVRGNEVVTQTSF